MPFMLVMNSPSSWDKKFSIIVRDFCDYRKVKHHSFSTITMMWMIGVPLPVLINCRNKDHL